MASRPAAETSVESPWAPLRQRVFRTLWLAVLGSQLGTWMQTVGAQWLLIDEPNAPTLVSLVQTASMLPVLLLALPGGALADIFDRRRMLIAVQVFQLIVAAAMTGLAIAGDLTPAMLLTLTFALGCGTALTLPTYQAVVPELVPRAQLPSASALGALSINSARAIGPALAGVLVAKVGVAAVFALNAVSFGAFALALFAWRRTEAAEPELSEPFVAALRAGGRYVRHSSILRRMLARLALFVLPGVCLWALLPVVASRRLNLGAGGYGLLLAAVGGGAIVGALAMPRVRGRLTDNRLTVCAGIVYAAALAVLALVSNPIVVSLALVPAGAAWVMVLSTANANVQMFLPRWVRARGLATYQIVFFGGQALGALAWGLVADQIGLVPTFLAAAVMTAAAAATVRIWPLIDAAHLDREPAVYWPEPQLAVEPDRADGPIVVEVTYTVPAENERDFLAAMGGVRRSRLRTGAVRWGLFREGELPRRFVEIYVVPTWDEHLRQHEGRLTGADRATEERARALCEGPPEVAHLLPAETVTA